MSFLLGINTHYNAPDQQHEKITAFTEIATVADYSVKYIWLTTPGEKLLS